MGASALNSNVRSNEQVHIWYMPLQDPSKLQQGIKLAARKAKEQMIDCSRSLHPIFDMQRHDKPRSPSLPCPALPWPSAASSRRRCSCHTHIPQDPWHAPTAPNCTFLRYTPQTCIRQQSQPHPTTIVQTRHSTLSHTLLSLLQYI